MVRRRTAAVGIEIAISCHTLGATGITDHLTYGGQIEVQDRVAGHANTKTSELYGCIIVTSAFGGIGADRDLMLSSERSRGNAQQDRLF